MSKSKRHSDTEKKVEAFDEREDNRHDRGFATMDPDKQRAIAKKGGEASHGGGRNPGDKNADTKMKEDLQN
jgi:general stress protein YciG